MSKLDDLTEKQFDSWFVIGRANKLNGLTTWLCQCVCGQQRNIRSGDLKTGKTRSCGCRPPDSTRLIDLTGREYGFLIVLERSTENNNSGHPMWICRCICGTVKSIAGSSLSGDLVISCGVCAKHFLCRTHGESRKGQWTKEYTCWSAIKSRCLNEKSHDYLNYGGRGITVCQRGFSNFLEDMGRKPSPKLSIHRVNNDGNYEPGNCKWATASNQRPRKKKVLEV